MANVPVANVGNRVTAPTLSAAVSADIPVDAVTARVGLPTIVSSAEKLIISPVETSSVLNRLM